MICHQHLCFFPVHHPSRGSHMGKKAGTIKNVRFLCQQFLDQCQIFFFLLIVWLIFLQLFLQRNHFPSLCIIRSKQTHTTNVHQRRSNTYPPLFYTGRRMKPSSGGLFIFLFILVLPSSPKSATMINKNINHLAKENIAI